MKKCIYCRQQIPDEKVVDVCDKCGKGVWGEKMFNAIIENMETARKKGDLHQGIIGFQKTVDSEDKKTYKL